MFCAGFSILINNVVDGPALVILIVTASWEIDGEAVETVSDFSLGGSKITADGDCSH